MGYAPFVVFMVWLVIELHTQADAARLADEDARGQAVAVVIDVLKLELHIVVEVPVQAEVKALQVPAVDGGAVGPGIEIHVPIAGRELPGAHVPVQTAILVADEPE